MGSGGGDVIEVEGPSCAVIAPAVVWGFGGSVVGTKVMGFLSSVVRGGGMIFGPGAIVGGIALGLMDEICCWVVWMEMLFLNRSSIYVAMKMRA